MSFHSPLVGAQSCFELDFDLMSGLSSPFYENFSLIPQVHPLASTALLWPTLSNAHISVPTAHRITPSPTCWNETFERYSK